LKNIFALCNCVSTTSKNHQMKPSIGHDWSREEEPMFCRGWPWAHFFGHMRDSWLCKEYLHGVWAIPWLGHFSSHGYILKLRWRHRTISSPVSSWYVVFLRTSMLLRIIVGNDLPYCDWFDKCCEWGCRSCPLQRYFLCSWAATNRPLQIWINRYTNVRHWLLLRQLLWSFYFEEWRLYETRKKPWWI
jgi:hypothetical protein